MIHILRKIWSTTAAVSEYTGCYHKQKTV